MLEVGSSVQDYADYLVGKPTVNEETVRYFSPTNFFTDFKTFIQRKLIAKAFNITSTDDNRKLSSFRTLAYSRVVNSRSIVVNVLDRSKIPEVEVAFLMATKDARMSFFLSPVETDTFLTAFNQWLGKYPVHVFDTKRFVDEECSSFSDWVLRKGQGIYRQVFIDVEGFSLPHRFDGIFQIIDHPPKPKQEEKQMHAEETISGVKGSQQPKLDSIIEGEATTVIPLIDTILGDISNLSTKHRTAMLKMALDNDNNSWFNRESIPLQWRLLILGMMEEVFQSYIKEIDESITKGLSEEAPPGSVREFYNFFAKFEQSNSMVAHSFPTLSRPLVGAVVTVPAMIKGYALEIKKFLDHFGIEP